MKPICSLIACTILFTAAASPGVAAASPEASAPAAMLTRTMAAVVQVEVSRSEGADPFANAVFGPAPVQPRGLLAAAKPGGGGGSGFIFDASGLVATNAHVVAGADTISVRLRDGRVLAAQLVGLDSVLDLAVLRIAAVGPLPVLQFGSSARLAQGDPVWALGAPMGYAFSVTAGVLSGRDRMYGQTYPVPLLQHDAALNPGNSGGPLIDAAGRVAGINTATPPETLFDIGIGLAIPAEIAAGALARLAQDGRIERGALGLSASAADTDIAAALGAPGEGLLIDQVTEGGAAQAAGLTVGDLLTRVNDVEMKEPRDVTRALIDSAPGRRVSLGYFRGGVLRTTTAVLAAQAVVSPSRQPTVEAPFDPGVSFGEPSEGGGVVVRAVLPRGAAERYGLRAGDVVRAIDGKIPTDAADAAAALDPRQSRVAVLRIERAGQGSRHLVLPLTAAAVAARPVGRVVDAVAGPF